MSYADSTQFKLTKPGRETRRFTFPNQPSWLALETRITSLFDIPTGKVGVAYEDNDGDVVTLSSQEELLDYFANCHKPGEPIKFTVIDMRELRSVRGEAAAFGEELREGSDGLPRMGPTMIFEVDDADWQRLPRIPELFGMSEDDLPGERHAFVEVVDSDASESKKASEPALSERMSRPLSHHSTDKGKAKATDTMSELSKATSLASIVNDDFPSKPPVHVYDVSDAGGLSPRLGSTTARTPGLDPVGLDYLNPGQPRYSAFGGGVGDSLGSLGQKSPTSPTSPYDIPEVSKPLPKTPSTRPTSFHPSAFAHSSQTTPRQPPALNLEDPPLEGTGEANTARSAGSTFIDDVANLLDGLTMAFAAHPELSEGLRNIVRNTVEGTYWTAERERVANAAENVRVTAEETSQRVSLAAQSFATHAEQDASKRISEALGGMFRVIGDLSSGISHLTSASTDGYQAPPPPPPPHLDPTNSQRQNVPMMPGGWPGFGGHPPPPPFMDPAGRPLPPYPRFGPVRFQGPPPPPPRPMQPGVPGHTFTHAPPLPPPPPMGLRTFDDPSISPRYRTLPWRMEQQLVNQPQRTNTWSGGHSPNAPRYAGSNSYDVYGDDFAPRPGSHESKAQLEAAKAFYKAEKERFRQEKDERRKSRREAAERRAEEGFAPRPDGTGREETIVARIPLPSPSKNGQSKRPYAEIYSVASQPKPVVPTVPIAPIPPSLPQQGRPLPTTSQGAGPSNLSDRVMNRLRDMGLTPYTHPNMINILNQQLYPNGEPTKDTEEDILAKTVHALDIRGSPSPRPVDPSLHP